MDEPTIPENAAFRIQLPTFEGPLDLLLHLIKQHELDILDLPIAFVTSRYLDYLQMMQELDLDIASEYLLMAATLAHIKSKMLLPQNPLGEVEEQDEGYQEDPRAQLIRRLLEYQKYREAAETLGARPIEGRDVFARGVKAPEAQGEAPLAPIDLYKLLDAFQGILKRVQGRASLEVSAERITIHERISALSELLRTRRRCTFEELFEGDQTRYEVVVTFLALLEMTKLRITRIYQADPNSPLHVQYALLDADAPTIPPEAELEAAFSFAPGAVDAAHAFEALNGADHSELEAYSDEDSAEDDGALDALSEADDGALGQVVDSDDDDSASAELGDDDGDIEHVADPDDDDDAFARLNDDDGGLIEQAADPDDDGDVLDAPNDGHADSVIGRLSDSDAHPGAFSVVSDAGDAATEHIAGSDDGDEAAPGGADSETFDALPAAENSAEPAAVTSPDTGASTDTGWADDETGATGLAALDEPPATSDAAVPAVSAEAAPGDSIAPAEDGSDGAFEPERAQPLAAWADDAGESIVPPNNELAEHDTGVDLLQTVAGGSHDRPGELTPAGEHESRSERDGPDPADEVDEDTDERRNDNHETPV